ncbi:MAG: hypothetical protein AAB442_01515 [Patescibacteria group bacterium]
MPPQPHHSEVPHFEPPVPHEATVAKKDSANEAAFSQGREAPRELAALSTHELFGRRKAHERIARDGWRDATTDRGLIEQIKAVMGERGVTEEEYKAFLSTTREPLH